jgi:PAS domain-containing protein
MKPILTVTADSLGRGYAQLTEQRQTGVSGSLTDITERKLAETAIQKLAAFPQVNPNPVLEFAADGTLTYANDSARRWRNPWAKTISCPSCRTAPGPSFAIV